MGRAGNIFQHTRQSPQHLHLIGAGRSLFSPAAAQPFQDTDGARLRLVHPELAEPCQFDDIASGKADYHRVTCLMTRFKGWPNRFDLIVEKQHRRDDNVRAIDIRKTFLERFRLVVPVGGGVKVQCEARDLCTQDRFCPLGTGGNVGVEGNQHDANGGR